MRTPPFWEMMPHLRYWGYGLPSYVAPYSRRRSSKPHH